MLFDVLGLTEEEALTYRALLARPSCAPAELADEFGMQEPKALCMLGRLEQLGLAARSGEDTSRFVASPPAVAMGVFLAQRQNELRLAELELSSLEETYRASASGRTLADVVDVVQGASAMRQRFEQLQNGARREVLTFVKAPMLVVPPEENTAENVAVARGVTYRAVIERPHLEDNPALLAEIRDLTARGSQVRVVDSLPLKLFVVDRELALVPVADAASPADSGALMVHRSGLLDALIALFETTWASSHHIVAEAGCLREIEPGAVDEEDVQILSLLVAGLNDKAIATQLGTSLRTVQRRVHALLHLADAQTRLQLGWRAARLGWI
ncbi:helix-turn-helix domain-containing protein [Streptomyces sp. NPDC058534]|uniref:helix-turn-helix domain-containing protein n=1 Tax=Streptomyces sp. NPDC058534 TaxID=3346541 RepID=UPI003661713A